MTGSEIVEKIEETSEVDQEKPDQESSEDRTIEPVEDAGLERIQREIQHGKRLLEIQEQRRMMLEERTARFGMDTPPHILVELEQVKQDIEDLEKQLVTLKNKADILRSDKEKQLAGGSYIAQAAPSGSATVNIYQTEDDSTFVPDWSVLRSKVRYVDANLALRFADESQNVNIMLGFMTLFLGAAISFGVALGTSDQPEDSILIGTATTFSVLLTIIFGLLTVRAWMKAESAKKQLLESGDAELKRRN